MVENGTLRMRKLGQSLWLSSLHADGVGPGRLGQLIETDGLSGVLFQMRDFERAIVTQECYAEGIQRQMRQGKTATEIYRLLAVGDVRQAAGAFRPLYQRTDGRDGFVSIAVPAELAYDAAGIIEEARALWDEVDCPNVLVRVPATAEARRAVRQLVADGVNVLVEGLLGVEGYRAVAEAYTAGLEQRSAQRKSLKKVTSVAGFALGSLCEECEKRISEGIPRESLARDVKPGFPRRVAIATAKIAYKQYWQLIHSPRFHTLALDGARAQRPLWATGKAADSLAQYGDDLTGPSTVRAISLNALEAIRHQTLPSPRLQCEWREAVHTLSHFHRIWPTADSAFEQLRDWMITRQVMHTDQTLIALEAKRPPHDRMDVRG